VRDFSLRKKGFIPAALQQVMCPGKPVQ